MHQGDDRLLAWTLCSSQNKGSSWSSNCCCCCCWVTPWGTTAERVLAKTPDPALAVGSRLPIWPTPEAAAAAAVPGPLVIAPYFKDLETLEGVVVVVVGVKMLVVWLGARAAASSCGGASEGDFFDKLPIKACLLFPGVEEEAHCTLLSGVPTKAATEHSLLRDSEQNKLFFTPAIDIAPAADDSPKSPLQTTTGAEAPPPRKLLLFSGIGVSTFRCGVTVVVVEDDNTSPTLLLLLLPLVLQ